MNEQLHLLATQYAVVMQEYYELEVHCETSELREDHLALKKALNAMLDLHNQMTNTARLLAEENC